MKLTKNFNSKEFDCKDGAKVPANLLPNLILLAKNLEIIREYFNAPVIILSGYRSPSHNKNVGGAKYSQHLKAKASDIRIEGFNSRQVYTGIVRLINDKKIIAGGVGLYNSFVHYDIRGYHTKWDLR